MTVCDICGEKEAGITENTVMRFNAKNMPYSFDLCENCCKKIMDGKHTLYRKESDRG